MPGLSLHSGRPSATYLLPLYGESLFSPRRPYQIYNVTKYIGGFAFNSYLCTARRASRLGCLLPPLLGRGRAFNAPHQGSILINYFVR